MTYYYWDFDTDNVFLEEDENGNVIAAYTQEPELYGELIAQERDGQVRYYNFDGQGSTRELTDENGDVTDTFTYTAFGEEVKRTGATANPFRYKGAMGYYTNSDTNDCYVRARTYEPTIARWLSLDPLTLNDARNRYIYASNSPIDQNDASGLWPTCFADYCTTTGPRFNTEGVILFRAEVIGDQCGQPGTEIQFTLKESKYLGPGKTQRDKKGRPSPCGQPANDELDEIFNAGLSFTYGKIDERGCSKPLFKKDKDQLGCWILEWTWKCPILCTNGRCTPYLFELGIYGPVTPADDPMKPDPRGPTYGISRYSLQTDARVSYDENCCKINACQISPSVEWQSYYFTDVGPPPEFSPTREIIRTTSNCSATDLARVRFV